MVVCCLLGLEALGSLGEPIKSSGASPAPVGAPNLWNMAAHRDKTVQTKSSPYSPSHAAAAVVYALCRGANWEPRLLT